MKIISKPVEGLSLSLLQRASKSIVVPVQAAPPALWSKSNLEIGQMSQVKMARNCLEVVLSNVDFCVSNRIFFGSNRVFWIRIFFLVWNQIVCVESNNSCVESGLLCRIKYFCFGSSLLC